MMDDPAEDAEPMAGPTPDGFATFARVLATLADSEEYAAVTDGLRRRLSAATTEMAAIAAERSSMEERAHQAEAADRAEAESLNLRYAAAEAKKRQLKPRHARISELIASWSAPQSTDPVERLRGTESPITIARRRHGLPIAPIADMPIIPPAPEPELPADHWHDGGFAADVTLTRSDRGPLIPHNLRPEKSATERRHLREARDGS